MRSSMAATLNRRPNKHGNANSRQNEITETVCGAENKITSRTDYSSTTSFRNREEELERVLDGLEAHDGQRFWLVIAPPQLGKSWFLSCIARKVSTGRHGQWLTNSIDLHNLPSEVRNDAAALARIIFAEPGQASTESSELPDIAREVLRRGQSKLCLLDSAELLAADVIKELRQRVQRINDHIESSMGSTTRFALVVASRRDREWLGITPRPRMNRLQLTEFKVGVLYQALSELAHNMNRRCGHEELSQCATLLHRLSEGLPALLVGYLRWIRQAQWMDLHRLDTQVRFDELVRPYIEHDLLSSFSLIGWSKVLTVEQSLLIDALRTLCPYRLLTQSHLSHHFLSGALAYAPNDTGWSVPKIWNAVGATDLLYRPQEEPWHQIHAPIRRLLFRYWYPSAAERVAVQRTAREFVQSFAADQLGSDQLAVLVECLWHEAQTLSGSSPRGVEYSLLRLAGSMSAQLKPNAAFSRETLREFAVHRMNADEEFANCLSNWPGLFERLVEVVLDPFSG